MRRREKRSETMTSNGWLWVAAATAVALIALSGTSRKGLAQNSAAPQRKVVITIDDVPGAIPYNDYDVGTLAQVREINRGITEALKKHHAWAIGFVNERKVQVKSERDARAAMLQLWLDSGLSLGNHTYTHLDFNDNSLMKYEDDTVRGDTITRPLMAAAGQTEKYFRHPYLDTGPTEESRTAFEQFLSDRDYTVAPVTVEDADYLFNDVLAYAREQKDKKLAERTREAYFDYFDQSFDYEEAASRALFQREIPQVLLMHDDQLNAENMDALLDRLERRGYTFVTLDDAMSDPAYLTKNLYIGSAGISWLERWRLAFGLKIEKDSGPEPPDWAQKIFDQVRHNKLE
jgi:peptidoglycan/xylan/chitin deacetylase (PgdA/CDA1 family)